MLHSPPQGTTPNLLPSSFSSQDGKSITLTKSHGNHLHSAALAFTLTLVLTRREELIDDSWSIDPGTPHGHNGPTAFLVTL